MRDDGNAGQDSLSIEGDSFIVLVNAEGQYSIWPSAKAAPDGWTQAAAPASKAKCIAFIEANWTDMRPKSLRAAMDGRTSEPK